MSDYLAIYCGALWNVGDSLYVVRTGGPNAGDVCPVVWNGPAQEVELDAPIGRVYLHPRHGFDIDELSAVVRTHSGE